MLQIFPDHWTMIVLLAEIFGYLTRCIEITINHTLKVSLFFSICRTIDRKVDSRRVSPSGKTTSGNQINQNSTTMRTEGHNFISLLIITTYMNLVFLHSTPIWYTTRLNHAPQFAGLPKWDTITMFNPLTFPHRITMIITS